MSVENPETGELTEIMLTGDLLVQAIAKRFNIVPYLPKTIYEVSEGDYEPISKLLPKLYAGDTGIGKADGFRQTVFCSEVNHLSIDDFETENTYPEIVQALTPLWQLKLDVCSLWDIETVLSGGTIKSDVPILIIEGAYDSVKSPKLAPEVAKNFTTSHLVEFSRFAHISWMDECSTAIVAEFLKDPTQSLDISCVPSEQFFKVSE